MISEWDWQFEQVKTRIPRAKLSVLRSLTAAGWVLTQQTLQGCTTLSATSSTASPQNCLDTAQQPGEALEWLQPSLPGAFSIAQSVKPYFWQEGRMSSAAVSHYFCCNLHICEEKQNAKHGRTKLLSPSEQPCAQVALPLQGCDPKLRYCAPCFGSSPVLSPFCAHLCHS